MRHESPGSYSKPSQVTPFFLITLRTGLQNAIANKGLITAHLGEVENPDLVSQVADFLLTNRQMRKSLCTGRFNGRLHVSLRLDRTTTNAGNILARHL